MYYNQAMITELKYIVNMPRFSFFDKALTEKIQQEIFVENTKYFFDRNIKAAKEFKNDYGSMRYDEVYNKMGLFYFINLYEYMIKQLREISINSRNDIYLKKSIDNIYGLFSTKVQDNVIVLSTAIWMVKDSCVRGNNTYLLTNTGYESSSRREIDYSLADGEHKPIKLTSSELNKVEKYYNLLMPIMLRRLNDVPKKNYSSASFYITEIDSLDRSKESSFVRALVALQNARSRSQLPEKIDHYIQLLQCIYNLKSSRNIKATLIEYTTRLLNSKAKESSLSNEDLNNVEEVVKTAFNIRSRHTHGNKINYDFELIRETSIQLDKYVREVLKMILPKKELDYNTKKEANSVTDYFKHLS